MANHACDIHLEQLRDGIHKEIQESFAPDFLEISEKDLSFIDQVLIEGETYLAGEMLLLHLNIEAHAIISCTICNGPVEVQVKLPNFYHAEPIAAIRGNIFNYGAIVREAIILETPAFAECNQGHCRHRKEIAKYLKPPSDKQNGKDQYHPFADL